MYLNKIILTDEAIKTLSVELYNLTIYDEEKKENHFTSKKYLIESIIYINSFIGKESWRLCEILDSTQDVNKINFLINLFK